jgi:4,5-DOPA dioxygenase extradiol
LLVAFPSFYVSHGSPTLAIEQSAARDFLLGFGKTLGRPRAIVIASAHFGSAQPLVTADAHPDMIYDFSGFPDELYRIVYPAPGDPALAHRVGALLQEAGLAPAVVEGRGFDHGAWVPLKLLYPEADIPVVQVSLQPHLGAAHHFAVGRALAPLRAEDILVIGSGSASHNLMQFYRGGFAEGDAAPPWVAAFEAWIHDKAENGAVDDLVNYRSLAPYARENHPTEEHFLPFHVALGAAGEGAKGKRVHASLDRGVLAMDCYTFQ